MLKREDIRIRDPFILVDYENKCYYMYGTTEIGTKNQATFSVYKSLDLENFEQPITVFDGNKSDFWTKKHYWAPEVFKYGDKYYMFATFGWGDGISKVQILQANGPCDEFKPIAKPYTPDDFKCLDGHMFVKEGRPYAYYTAWDSDVNSIYCVEMSNDLTKVISEPKFQFSKRDYMKSFGEDYVQYKNSHVAEAVFVFCENSKYYMLWSGFEPNGKYVVYCSVSDRHDGGWKHSKKLLYGNGGGHAMSFVDLDGQRKIAFHSPNEVSENLMIIPFNRRDY